MQSGNSHAKRCGGKTRKGGKCQNWAMANGRCRMHNGNAARGIGHPNTTHGRYSKYLPTRLAGKYLEAQADTELLNLRSEIALIDTRTIELIKQIDTGESGRIWQAVRDVYRDFNTAYHGKDGAGMALCLTELDHLIKAGVRQYAVWGEITGNIEKRRKLVESEHKWMVQNQQMITSERAMLLMAAVVSIIKEQVDDRDTLAAISAGIGKLITIDAS